jgi:hypothetical protein
MSTVQIDKSVIERVIDALKRERVSVLDHGYPIQVASSNVEIALAELRAALAASQAVEPEPMAWLTESKWFFQQQK